MKRIFITIISLLAFTLVISDQKSFAADKEPFKIIKVADLSKMMSAKKKPIIFDANTEETRNKQGLIPGAIPLESAGSYDVAKTLPPNKKSPMVFYCHSTA
jgi:hypothetical protein